MAAQVAKVDSTVLITGESGVGKEIVAKAIHRMSPRSEGPLIMINCGAIPETLLESELFGYESGAFTGARRQGKPGMLEMAKKGTLFLDEIGDISFSLQAKLLRAIQDHQIMRVGGLKPLAVDARIVAATNKNLDEMVKAGLFRDDLYYRLNVVAIEIPPLRERKEDIPLLVLHFIKKLNNKYRFQKRIHPEVVDCFMMHQWPGNIRELENVIERMLVMTEEEEISAKHLPLNLRNQVYPDGKPFVLNENLPFKKVLERTEKHLLEEAIRMHGSTRKVARALRINQSTVVRKLKKYELSSLCREPDEPASPFEDLKFRL
jgi:transcriptional regulator with PAS, ATPase and Fis domain